MKKSFFLIISLPFLLFACSEKRKSCADLLQGAADTTRIVTVACRYDSSQRYEVYLPGNYTPDKKWPVLLCFDPHADGRLPVKLFSSVAEKFGYIVAGSDNSANGVANIEYVVRTFYEDVTSRYSIDSTRIYAAGFSGGGRIAASLALSWSHIRGVISCSAGLPGFQPASGTRAFAIAALAGDGDFNYSEVESLPEQLKGTKFNVYTSIFHGTHAWPSREQLSLALLFLHIKAMQEGIVATDRQIISCLKNSLLDSVGYYHQRKNIADEFAWAERGASLLAGYKEANTFRKRVKKISSTPEFRKFLSEKEQVLRMEEMLRMEYQKAFTEKDTSWWRNEADVLRTRLTGSSDGLKKAMHERLLAYLSIMAYTYTNRSIQAGNLEAARHFVSIYGIIDPQNPDYLKFRKQLAEEKYIAR